MSRLVADENVRTEIVAALRHAGHDVVWITETAPSWDDSSILAFAVVNDRILLTYDRDFGELVFRLGQVPPPAIIYVRLSKRDVAGAVDRLLSLLAHGARASYFTIIDPGATRERPFTLAE